MLILRIIFIILVLFSLFNGNSNYILACGIFAWVGKDIKYFRRDLFNILGMYNDSRGGDSCGVYFDDMWYKGIGTTAKYEKLIPEFDLHNTLKLKINPVIIGHDRKVSVGSNTLVNTQPVILADKDQNIGYVHAHNGTIGNYEELAKKHNVILENNESDSIAIAKLIDLIGFDILGEYEGTGAFVMYFKNEPNILYAFHGKSKTYANGVAVDERPLAYLNIPGKGTYISSELAHLNNIANPKKDIKPCEFKYNVLYKLEGDTVTEVKEIDRTNIHPTVYKSTKLVYTSGYGVGYNSSRYDDYYYGNSSESKTTSKNLYDYPAALSKNHIRWSAGLYRVDDNGKIAHGTYYMTNYGYLCDENKLDKYKDNIYELNFIYGILMKDRKSYELLNTFLLLKEITEAKDFYNETTFRINELTSKLKEYSLQPFHRYDVTAKITPILKPNNIPTTSYYQGTYYLSGNFRPILSRYDFRTNAGDIVSYVDDKTMLSIEDFCRDTLIFDYDFDVTDEKTKDQIIAEVSTHWKDLFIKSDFDCRNCNLYNTHPEYCNNYCTSWKNVEEPEKSDSDKAYETAYDNYDFMESNKEIAMSLILSNFKELSKPLEDVINTIDDIGTTVDLDSEVLDVVETVKVLSNKLSKY